MQKIIAQELGLHDVMPLFDKEDEDDDFRGVDDSSRGEITSIGIAIWQSLIYENFLVIFQCGIDEDINLEEFGIPFKFGSPNLLWTNCGRFQLVFQPPDYLKLTSSVICLNEPLEAFLLALHEEAVELIRYMGTDNIKPDLIVECYKYLVFLICQGRFNDGSTVDYGWTTHACNYWVCDGILQGGKAWEIGDALHRLLIAPLSYDKEVIDNLSDLFEMELKIKEWFSSSSDQYEPPKRNSTSYFLAGHHRWELQTDSFQHAKNLRVLKLCNCNFEFSSPPFLCCQNLRFLWLDTCTDNKREQAIVPSSFPNLWVFDLRFTEYVYLPQVAEMMRDLRELNAKGVSWNIISQKLRKLNLSGTAIKRLDLGAMDVRMLKYLFLLGCEKLQCLRWDGNNPKLEVLQVDTRGKASSVMCCGEQKNLEFVTDVTFLDGRFVWSAMQGIYTRVDWWMKCHVHLHISCTVNTRVHIAKNIEDTVPNNGDSVATGPFLSPYMDVHHLAKDIVHPGLLWDCRRLELLYLHLEIGEGSYNLERMEDVWYFRNFTEGYTESLHVHENSSITALPKSPASWLYLQWCHVERCPKLQTLFTSRTTFTYGEFSRLETFSAIDLPMAHWIWGKGINNTTRRHYFGFTRLQHIYLNNCPRLVYVLPVSFDLPSLETIQIEYCSNLKCIFPLDDKYPQGIEDRVVFSKLKRIKLRYLHSMKQICEARVSFAPELEMISVRDCWGLRRLPAISDQYSQRPIVECEKDWWDELEWDGPEANHHPSRFQARHSSRYYKKTILRASVLSLSLFTSPLARVFGRFVVYCVCGVNANDRASRSRFALLVP
ncbi:hypothetical protein EJB05_33910, partial [Eragrostis curvula]